MKEASTPVSGWSGSRTRAALPLLAALIAVASLPCGLLLIARELRRWAKSYIEPVVGPWQSEAFKSFEPEPVLPLMVLGAILVIAFAILTYWSFEKSRELEGDGNPHTWLIWSGMVVSTFAGVLMITLMVAGLWVLVF